MNKIPTLFVRDENDRRYVTDRVTPECEWVIAGEGRATRKFDGTCVMCDDNGEWWARREVKPDKAPPPGYDPISTDPVTGKTVGWEPIEQSGFYKPFLEAYYEAEWDAGTYELVGPKINGNPEDAPVHRLIEHATASDVWFPLEPSASLIAWTVSHLPFEGVVWHHPDGRMAKLKRKDIRP